MHRSSSAWSKDDISLEQELTTPFHENEPPNPRNVTPLASEV